MKELILASIGFSCGVFCDYAMGYSLFDEEGSEAFGVEGRGRTGG